MKALIHFYIYFDKYLVQRFEAELYPLTFYIMYTNLIEHNFQMVTAKR